MSWNKHIEHIEQHKNVIIKHTLFKITDSYNYHNRKLNIFLQCTNIFIISFGSIIMSLQIKRSIPVNHSWLKVFHRYVYRRFNAKNKHSALIVDIESVAKICTSLLTRKKNVYYIS